VTLTFSFHKHVVLIKISLISKLILIKNDRFSLILK
jgi:hypothetical protein